MCVLTSGSLRVRADPFFKHQTNKERVVRELRSDMASSRVLPRPRRRLWRAGGNAGAARVAWPPRRNGSGCRQASRRLLFFFLASRIDPPWPFENVNPADEAFPSSYKHFLGCR